MSESSASDDQEYLEYPKTVGMASYYGLDYEVALCSLLFMRGVNRCWSRELDAFFLASNHADAGLFDDVVMVTSLRDRHLALLVQVKHKNSCKVGLDALCGKGHRQRASKDFRLLNYWESYRELSRRWRHFTVADGVALPVAQTLYVLYTNAGPQDTGGDPVDAEESLQPLLTAEDGPGLRFRFDAAAPALPGVSRGEAETFLHDFRLLAGQPDYAALGAFVEREVATALLTPASDTRVVAEALRSRVKDWRDKTPSAAYLGKDSALWTELLRERVRHFNGHIMVEDNNFCLKYRVPLEDLATAVRDARRPLALVARERMTKAVLWKVYQALGDDALVVSEQTLRWRREELLRLWTRRPCRVLLVEAEGDLDPELLADLEGVLDGDATKRLVAVTYGVQEARRWLVRNVDVAWTDVEPDSLEQLLDLYAKRFDQNQIKPQTPYLYVVICRIRDWRATSSLRVRFVKSQD